jgi:hypothetical protein
MHDRAEEPPTQPRYHAFACAALITGSQPARERAQHTGHCEEHAAEEREDGADQCDKLRAARRGRVRDPLSSCGAALQRRGAGRFRTKRPSVAVFSLRSPSALSAVCEIASMMRPCNRGGP